MTKVVIWIASKLSQICFAGKEDLNVLIINNLNLELSTSATYSLARRVSNWVHSADRITVRRASNRMFSWSEPKLIFWCKGKCLMSKPQLTESSLCNSTFWVFASFFVFESLSAEQLRGNLLAIQTATWMFSTSIQCIDIQLMISNQFEIKTLKSCSIIEH